MAFKQKEKKKKTTYNNYQQRYLWLIDADTVSLSVISFFGFDFSFVFVFISKNLHSDQKLQMQFSDDFIKQRQQRQPYKKSHFTIFLFRKFAEIALFCIKMPSMFVKTKKKIKIHYKHIRKNISICVTIKHISVNVISKSKTVFCVCALNHSMVNNSFMCAKYFFFVLKPKPGKFSNQDNNNSKNEIRQAVNIRINLEKNETIGWKNVRFTERQIYCLKA